MGEKKIMSLLAHQSQVIFTVFYTLFTQIYRSLSFEPQTVTGDQVAES